MRAKIDGVLYDLNTSFMTAFRYRVQYKKSILSEEYNDYYEKKKMLLCLLYTSIEGEKPFLHVFEEKAERDSGEIYALSKLLYDEIITSDESITLKTSKSVSGGERKFDEYELMAVFAHTGLPPFLLSEMSLMQVSGLISKYYELESREQKREYVEMDNAQKLNFYGITPEQLKQIKEHMGKNT